MLCLPGVRWCNTGPLEPALRQAVPYSLRPELPRRSDVSARSAICDARLERDLGAGQSAGNRAVLCLFGQILKGRLVNTGYVADRAELDPGDVESGANLGERDPCRGAQVPRGMTRLAEQVRERHREAGRFGRAEQLLRIRSRAALVHAGPQRI